MIVTTNVRGGPSVTEYWGLTQACEGCVGNELYVARGFSVARNWAHC